MAGVPGRSRRSSGLKKELREWLEIESSAATLPTFLTLLARALAALWPKWSADDAKRGQYHKPSTDELCSQKNFDCSWM